MNEFQDLDVVVTGGAGALGISVVEALLARGAMVHVPLLSEKHLEPVPDAIRARVAWTPGVDLTDEDLVAGYYEGLPSLWGSIHCAGGFGMSPFVETSLADLEKLFRLNVATAFVSCREAVRRMKAGNGGRIVNVIAKPALQPADGAGLIAYTSTKAAVAAMTVALAAEVASDGIGVSAVAPSIIDSPANREAMPKAKHEDWPKPAELAETIVQLASPTNRVASGALVPVYGRLSAATPERG